MNTRISLHVPGSSLLPQVPRLRYQFCADFFKNWENLAKNLDQVRRITVGLEHLPYCLGGASLAMFDLVRDQNTVVTAKAAGVNPGTTLELSEAERNILGYRLDSFLDFARRAQNAIVPYFRRKFLELRFDKSLHKVIEAIGKGKLALPDPFKSRVLEYWNKYGASLRNYRNLGQHYAIVGNAAKVVVPRDGLPALLFCLPNNPDVSPISDLHYDNPQVHVQQFVLEQFFELLAFSYGIMQELLDPEIDAALVPALEGKFPLTRSGSGSGTHAYVPLGVDELEIIVQDALKKLNQRESPA